MADGREPEDEGRAPRRETTPPGEGAADPLRALHDALGTLTRSDALARGDLPAALGLVGELAARLVGVRRVSTWRLERDGQALECADLYDAVSGTHSRGLRLTATDAPRYFAAIAAARVIAADDATTDPRTADFTEGYLRPLGIAAMLDAPVLLRGTLAGVLCLEHVGRPRAWKAWEQLVAGSLGDFVGTALAASEHLGQARELAAYRDHLEQLVEARTAELRRAEQNVRAVFDLAPVALVVSRLSDQVLIDGNRRATALFEVDADATRGRRAPDFWANPADRDRLRAAVQAQGRVDDFEAELLTQSGRRFWAELSAAVTQFDGVPALLVGGHDITARKQAEASRERREDTLRTLLDAAPMPLVVTRVADGTVRYANRHAAEMFEVPLDALVGQRAGAFYADRADQRTLLGLLAREGHVDAFVLRLRTAGGREFWVQLGARALEIEGEAVLMLGLADLSAQKALEDQLRTLANIDGLTGATSRRHFFELGAAELDRASRYGHATTLAMLDVDHFKSINDDLGHAVGDVALRALVDCLRGQVRKSDLVARYGGEEFVVLLPETRIDQASAMLERVRARVAEVPLGGGARPRRMTVSIGVAERRPGEPLEDLLRRADAALYRAKAAGRDRLVASTQAIDTGAQPG